MRLRDSGNIAKADVGEEFVVEKQWRRNSNNQILPDQSVCVRVCVYGVKHEIPCQTERPNKVYVAAREAFDNTQSNSLEHHTQTVYSSFLNAFFVIEWRMEILFH